MKLIAQKAKPEASTRPVSGPWVQQDREKEEGKTGLHGKSSQSCSLAPVPVGSRINMAQ